MVRHEKCGSELVGGCPKNLFDRGTRYSFASCNFVWMYWHGRDFVRQALVSWLYQLFKVICLDVARVCVLVVLILEPISAEFEEVVAVAV
jgi:hypothetical protein